MRRERGAVIVEVVLSVFFFENAEVVALPLGLGLLRGGSRSGRGCAFSVAGRVVSAGGGRFVGGRLGRSVGEVGRAGALLGPGVVE